MDTETMERIGSLASEVNAQSAALEAAVGAERAAEAALLDRIVELVRPALRALGSRPVIAYSITGHADVNRERDHTERATWRGLAVSCAAADLGPVRQTPRDNDGEYGGCDLLLRADGAFVELCYGGGWSKWQGSSWGWTATERVMTILEVVTEYRLEAITDHVRGALEQYAAGNASERTKRAHERAAKLRAVLALL